MNRQMLARVLSIVTVFVLLVLFATPVMAWWSGWYCPNFSGSYSPSSYQHGQWDASNNGGSEVFGSAMKWNQSRADGVRAYSTKTRFITWCGWCNAYFTHDHKDMSSKLNGWGVASNLPGAKYDLDDDNGDRLWEEVEVTSVDKSFPATNSQYYFYSYYTRSKSGSGTLYETPAVSAKNVLSGEYDTYKYDRNQSLGYDTNRTASWSKDASSSAEQAQPEPSVENKDVNPLAEQAQPEPPVPVGELYSATISGDGFSVNVAGREGGTTLKVGLASPIQDAAQLQDYIEWARNYPIQKLREAGIGEALTVITFRQPILPDVLNGIIGSDVRNFTPEVVKGIYMNDNDPSPATQAWTLQARVAAGQDYADQLRALAADIQTHGLDANMDLTFEGIAAITGWLPVETVERLNNHELVFLADASPSYLRLVAANTEHAQRIRGGNTADNLKDGLPSSIVPKFNDVFAESRVFAAQ